MTDREQRLAEIKARRERAYPGCGWSDVSQDVDWLIAQLEATQNALDKALGQQAGKDGT